MLKLLALFGAGCVGALAIYRFVKHRSEKDYVTIKDVTDENKPEYKVIFKHDTEPALVKDKLKFNKPDTSKEEEKLDEKFKNLEKDVKDFHKEPESKKSNIESISAYLNRENPLKKKEDDDNKEK